MPPVPALLAAALLSCTAGCDRPAEPRRLRVAVASNFTRALEEVAARFTAGTGIAVEISSASTGKLFAQIENGAPFDLFLAADLERPRRLLATGRADPDLGAVPYALGRLALYGRGLDPADGAATLRAGAFTHLAVANPKTAPYGAAALEALAALGLREAVEPRLVFGENIGQAMQFVDSGAAEFGLCALSQVVDRDPAHRWIVPATLHAPIAQGAVLLGEALDPGAARDFLRFLSGPAAHEVLRRFGYEPVED